MENNLLNDLKNFEEKYESVLRALDEGDTWRAFTTLGNLRSLYLSPHEVQLRNYAHGKNLVVSTTNLYAMLSFEEPKDSLGELPREIIMEARQTQLAIETGNRF